MALKKNYSRTLLRNFIILIFLFVGMLLFSSILFYDSFQEKSVNSAKSDYEIKIKYYTDVITNKILLDDMDAVYNLTEEVNKSNYIKNVNIKLKRYFFDKDTLLFKTPSFNDKTWELGNIEIDIKFGSIQKLKNSYFYEFIPSKDFDISQDLIIRYQAYKGGKIRNFLTKLNFSIEESKFLKKHENIAPDWISYIYESQNDKKVENIDLNGMKLGEIVYELDDTIVKYEIYDFITNLLIYTVVVFLPILIVINFYQRYVYNNYVVKPINYLNKYVSNILDKKFKKINNKEFEDIDDFKELTDNISKISSNMASLVNELNISKESLERKLSTDNLTGLSNKKIFELDIKSMFVSSSEAYVLTIKIDSLQEIKSPNGSIINFDDFIQSFVNNINNSIHKSRKLDVKFYRFFGLEFFMILKKVTFEECESVVQNILTNLEEKLSTSYTLPNNYVNIGGTPFDTYGSLFSIIDNAKKAYEESRKIDRNSYLIIKETDTQKTTGLLESSVNKIIDNKEFDIVLVYDTFSLYDNSIIMKELKPILLDDNQNEIPIGSFVSISEKINRVFEFDTEVIIKALNFINANKIEHKIAINLSMDTISNRGFYDFVKNINKKTPLLKEKIIFSITSYTASSYKSRFIGFVNKMNELGVEVLLKRYQTKEISLDELANIPVDYVRMHKDYTSSINNDLVKKHKIKNIIIFGELNNVKIMADSVESDQDYALLDRLDLYATSR